ncbi:hypothetical protein C8R46DRAFT_1197368 [Mycena filopes]|nr:hypothetical protein C8R46DRAFT_1197368 [Mycena filopes]
MLASAWKCEVQLNVRAGELKICKIYGKGGDGTGPPVPWSTESGDTWKVPRATGKRGMATRTNIGPRDDDCMPCLARFLVDVAVYTAAVVHSGGENGAMRSKGEKKGAGRQQRSERGRGGRTWWKERTWNVCSGLGGGCDVGEQGDGTGRTLRKSVHRCLKVAGTIHRSTRALVGGKCIWPLKGAPEGRYWCLGVSRRDKSGGSERRSATWWWEEEKREVSRVTRPTQTSANTVPFYNERCLGYHGAAASI